MADRIGISGLLGWGVGCLHLSVCELLGELAGIGETVLVYPSTGGRPKVRRMTTEMSPTQEHLYDIFDLRRYVPRTS